MSEPHVTQPPAQSPPSPIPVHPASRSAGRSSLFGIVLTFSLLFNCLAVLVLVIVCFGVFSLKGLDSDSQANTPLSETFHSGSASAKDKIAIVEINGVIMEGLLNYPHKQIEQAVEDDQVKAVVLRINSPGGSITGSDDLHRRIVNLRDGTTPGKKAGKKPLIVSMGSLAASGGYYIAAPAQTILAERTTMTGSIGVYSSFPNISGFAQEHKFGMVTIKQGQIKDSGSPFKEMSPHELQVWQDLVDHSYLQFLDVVVSGRGEKLKRDLLEEFVVEPLKGQQNLRHPPPSDPYKRYLADGGVYTVDEALKQGLIDQIGYLEDAILVAQKAAGLGSEYKAISYERQRSPLERILNVTAKPPNTGLLDPGKVKNGFLPRLWYLMPGSEVSGILAGMDTPEDR